jgi:guanylate kinase
MAKLFIVSAPSGAGKNTLIRYALAHVPGLVYSVSATTRKPRPGEREGREYFFKTPEAFRAMIADGELAEYQEVYGGVLYGSPRKFIEENLEQGRGVILDIDVYGKTKLEKVFPEAVSIFIDVPSIGVLRERLQKRNAENAGEIEKRLRKAEEELGYSQGKYRYRVVNNTLETACRELADIISKEQGGPPEGTP